MRPFVSAQRGIILTVVSRNFFQTPLTKATVCSVRIILPFKVCINHEADEEVPISKTSLKKKHI